MKNSTTHQAAPKHIDSGLNQYLSNATGARAADAPVVPAMPFVQRFIMRNGRYICGRCEAAIRTHDLPHDCRSYTKPWGAR